MRTHISFTACLVAMAVAALALHAAPVRPAVTVVRLPDGALQPQLAVDAKGVTHVLYYKGEGAHGDLYYSRLDAANQFSTPIRVNSHAGSAIATGTIRGGHLALGRNGRVHVAWHGSNQADPRAPGGETPVLYTRLNDAGLAFEIERNVVQRRLSGLDAGTVAADAAGNVYVAWHAFEPGKRGEEDRRVWIARSTDDGRTFAAEAPASEAATGACGCCSVGLGTDRKGTVYALYRAAVENVHRDVYLLLSRDHGQTFTSDKLQEWNVNACPMSSYALAEVPGGMLAAWETDGQVQWTRIDAATGTHAAITPAAGATKTRKHPVLATNSRGDVLLAWTEGTSFSKGGDLAWQLSDSAGSLVEQKRVPGVPAMSLAGVAARPDGGFTIVY